MTYSDVNSSPSEKFEELFQRVREVGPGLIEACKSAEYKRTLPRAAVEMLRSAGVFRMCHPETEGGLGLSSWQQVQIIEEIARHDAAAGWCVMIGCDSGIYSGFIDREAEPTLYQLDEISAGWIHPQGRAVRVDGGYAVSGRWMFGSGCMHADWLAAGCLVEPLVGSPSSEPSEREWRIMVARPSDFKIFDTWHTLGLSGTGSHDYSAEGLFIPHSRSFSLYSAKRRGPLNSTPDAILRKMPGVPLGIARSVLDYLFAIAPSKHDRLMGMTWTESPRVRAALADFEGNLFGARAAVRESIEAIWNATSTGRTLASSERAMAAVARRNSFQACRDIVRGSLDLLGGGSVYRDTSPLERALRDIETACQHAVAQEAVLQSAGAVLFGDTGKNLFI